MKARKQAQRSNRRVSAHKRPKQLKELQPPQSKPIDPYGYAVLNAGEDLLFSDKSGRR